MIRGEAESKRFVEQLKLCRRLFFLDWKTLFAELGHVGVVALHMHNIDRSGAPITNYDMDFDYPFSLLL